MVVKNTNIDNNKMQINQSFLVLLRKLWKYISKKRQRQLLYLIILTLLSSIAEIVSLGAVIPFIGVITNPDKVFQYTSVKYFASILNINNSSEIVLPISIAFAFISILVGVFRMRLLKITIELSNSIGAEISIEAYLKTLYQPYKTHISRSSSEIISGITQKVSNATTVLLSVVIFFTSLILFTSIILTLFYVDPVITFLSLFSFSIVYLLLGLKTRSTLVRNSKIIVNEQTQVIKSLQEGLGAIRDVILDETQHIYADLYKESILKLNKSHGTNSFINQAPRFAMEAIGMALIALLVLVFQNRPGGLSMAIPTLGMLALGAQRMLPLMNQIFGNWTALTGGKASLVDVLNLLEQKMPIESDYITDFRFQNNIKFSNVYFKYNENTNWVLKGINIEIEKGEMVGFIGSTGCGKSTLFDILMGLLEPTKGNLIIDGDVITNISLKYWQKTIAHVPQTIFLSDATIAENIAFGTPKKYIDYERVMEAAKKAKIHDFIIQSINGYQTNVGERGVKLSGGQRQRIAIARALYKKAQVLIFDEATSALDNETENEIMETIENLNKDLTILIIAHRISTLKKCDKIYKINNGNIENEYKYEEIKDLSIK